MIQQQSVDDDIRNVAQTIFDQIGINRRSPFDNYRQLQNQHSHSVNLFSDEFLGGYMQDGRMSVVRRFFCLFVTFDLVFVTLLWLICIVVNGGNIYDGLKAQILFYNISTSMFDIVIAAVCRFVVLLLFYALLSFNHWFIISMSTAGSCFFLICKVFVYTWVDSSQQVFQVVLIVTSFVLSWGEAWFLDCRVIPQEHHARNHYSAITSMNSDRSALLAPFLQSISESQPPESIANFYSPYDSISNSDEEDEQIQEYVKMGIECVQKAYEYLRSDDWKVEKVTGKGDTIQSVVRDQIGKVYRLTGKIRFPAKKLLHELFYQIEHITTWNPSILESKIILKINSHTDIAYNATIGGGGGLIKKRDFVNLRCWRMFENGKLINDVNERNECFFSSYCENSISTISDNRDNLIAENIIRSTNDSYSCDNDTMSDQTLSKSIAAKSSYQYDDLNSLPMEDKIDEKIPKAVLKEDSPSQRIKRKNRIYVSAAMGIETSLVPINLKYTRGKNIVSCWAMKEIEGQPEYCIFEWLSCLDLKGYIPKRILETAYITLMEDYMVYLRKYCSMLRQNRSSKLDQNKS